VSDALVGQIDLFATFAALTGQHLPADAAPDSQNVLPALLGDSPRGRDWLVEQAGALSIISGRLKYIEPNKGAAVSAYTNVELGNAPAPQLYDLGLDPGERDNLAAGRPDDVTVLAQMLARVRSGDLRPPR
jgi:arylsulfatase A-like enzyme